MNLLRRLIPPFLRQLDLWLQEHHPRLWSTRLHLHVWFMLLLDGLALMLGLFIPVDLYGFPEPEEVWAYMMVPAVVYAAFWVFRVVLFTVERRFGIRRSYASVGELLIHWLSLLLILTLPTTLAVTIAYRIGHLVPDERFNADVNALNELEPWLYGNDTHDADDDRVRTVSYAMETAMDEVDVVAATARRRVAYHTRQGSGTHRFFHSLDEYRRRDDMPDNEVETDRSLHELYEDHVSVYNNVADPDDSSAYNPDTAAYHLPIIDSIETHFPLLRTQLGSFTPYERWNGRAMDTDSVLELRYLERYAGPGPPDAATIEATLKKARAYSPNVQLLPASQVLAEYKDREASTTSLWSAESTISDVAEAKAYDYEFLEWEAILYGMVLSTFCIALLISIFKNLYWQPFLIAVVTAMVLPILILVFSLITENLVFHVDEEVIMLWCYYLLVVYLLVMQFRVPTLKAYRTVPAVMNILANVAAPAFFLFTLFLLNERFDIFGYNALQQRIYELRDSDPNSTLLTLLEHQQYALGQRIFLYMQIAGWGGVLFYTFALHPFFRWCQTRLMALPERK
ncbi:MAG: hypothetical protein IPN38_02130 [Flavobacteriales bacterium]|nr:hypothetical protein [Flavobacteriales bacterium]